MVDKIKYMDLKEFQEKGYLQEANRLLFHRLGLALEMEFTDEADGGEPTGLLRIWDYRNDPEGMLFGQSVTTKPEFAEKAEWFAAELEGRKKQRRNRLGWEIQPPYQLSTVKADDQKKTD